jgi:hypothetical protein
MRVFISWSGDRGLCLANALERFLPRVLQSIEPWVSTGIPKGSPWPRELLDNLGAAQVGLVCITPESSDSTWLNFEAGALSRTQPTSVSGIVLDMRPTQVPPPLGLFQLTEATYEDTLRLAKTINRRCEQLEEQSITEQVLEACFNAHWQGFAQAVATIEKASAPAKRREPGEMIEEALGILRSNERGFSELLGRREQQFAALLRDWATLTTGKIPSGVPSVSDPVDIAIWNRLIQFVLAEQRQNAVHAVMNYLHSEGIRPKKAIYGTGAMKLYVKCGVIAPEQRAAALALAAASGQKVTICEYSGDEPPSGMIADMPE